jgi:hypothetical protein
MIELSPGSSIIELRQRIGPLQVIHLGTGLLVVELPRGERRVRVSLAPGQYLVRRRTRNAVLAREVRLGAGGRVQVTEASLTPVLVAGNGFASKGAAQVTAEAEAQPEAKPAPRAWSGDPPHEWMLSVSSGWPRYRSFVNHSDPAIGAYSTTVEDPSWSVELGYLRRHGRFLGTRLGLGFARPTNYGDGSASATVGEALSWPLLVVRHPVRGTSPYAIEPYVAAQLTGRYEFESGGSGEIPYRLQGTMAGGVRLSVFYAQIGLTLDLLPRDVTISTSTRTETFSSARPGPMAEVGIRLTGDIF